MTSAVAAVQKEYNSLAAKGVWNISMVREYDEELAATIFAHIALQKKPPAVNDDNIDFIIRRLCAKLVRDGNHAETLLGGWVDLAREAMPEMVVRPAAARAPPPTHAVAT